ncbi:MAG: hypothetical protein ACOC3W_04215, partial [Thermodesulfobacteriota bacterium]
MNSPRYLIAALAVGSIITFFGCASTMAGADTAGGSKEKAAYAKPGFHTMVEDGRLWVFRQGAEEYDDYRKHGELAKHVIRPAAGPGGVTIKAPDTETMTLYLSAKPGFHVALEDGRLWVFRQGAEEYDAYRKHGELAKHVIRPAAGPGGITLKAPDVETLDDYLAAR